MTLNLLAPSPLRPAYADPAPVLRPPQPIDALYVHIPFCSSKCHYCDFYSLAGHLDRAEPFLDALAAEIQLHHQLTGEKPRPETIFIGGGTPTLLAPAHLERLLRTVGGAIDTACLTEFTVEANPNTFDPQRAQILADHGVNRISFGAQSFIPAELRTLQRDHDPESVPAAVDTARNAGIHRLNIDLIFGIPGQTLDTLAFSLDRALELQPQHLSCYSLIYEPNTAMTARMRKGEFAPMDEELELAMFELVHSRLRDAGFARYEVSNHARPNEECRHNLLYWKAANWLAWGPSAAGHLGQAGVGNARWKNVGSLAHYLDALSGPDPRLPWTEFERRNPRAWAAEAAAFWLRLAAGLDYAQFARRTGVDPRHALEPLLQKYAVLGLVRLTPLDARLTDPGVLVSNRIFADVLDGLTDDPVP